MPIVACVSDLIFESKIAATADALEIDVRIVRTLPAARDACDAADALLLDLSAAPETDLLPLIHEIRSARPDLPITGFLAHVQVDLAQRAVQAGADQALARSAFVERLPALLRSFTANSRPARE